MAVDLGTAYIPVKPDLSSFGRDLDAGVSRAVSSTGTRVGRFASGTVRTLGRVGMAFGAIGIAGGVAGLKIASDMEQAEIAFTTMLGSAQEAERFLGELSDFAAATPFELPDVRVGAQRLLAMGFEAENVIPTLEAVGNAVAGVGGSSADVSRVTTILGQIQAKGRLQAEEMMQLNEAGVFSWQRLADEMGTSVPKAMDEVSAGAVSSSEFMTAFMGSTAENFGGMMEKQSQTLLGLFSTAKDQISIALAGAAETIGPTLSKAIGPVTDTITKLIEVAGPPLFDLIGSIAGIAGPLIEALAPVAKVIAEVANELGKVLAPFIEAMAPILGQFARALGQILLALLPLLPPIGELIVALSPLLVVVAQLLNELLIPLVPVLAQIVGTIAKVVAGFVAWAKQVGVFRLIGVAARALGTLIGSVFRFMTHTIAAAWTAIFRGAVAAWNGIRNVVSSVIARVRGVVVAAVGFLAGVWDRVKNGASTAWNAIVGIVKGAINGVIGAYNSLDVAVGPWSIPGWVPVVGGNTFHIPDLFPDVGYLAAGGVTRRPLLSVLNEKGPEAVVPLTGLEGRRAMAEIAAAAASGASGSSLKLVSGELELRGGRAYVRGIAREELEAEDRFRGRLARRRAAE